MNIPHSSSKSNSIWDDNEIKKDIDIWTDWYTDVLFGSTDNRVLSFVFPLSRFDCDCERLINDPLNIEGRGIIYTKFNQKNKLISEYECEQYLSLYLQRIADIRACLNDLTNPILIDCHSFPSFECEDVDVCIGYNEDNSRPDEEILKMIETAFTQNGYKVAMNKPYSNSFSPKAAQDYPSLMIELNKKIYMDEQTLKPYTHKVEEIRSIISNIYARLLE